MNQISAIRQLIDDYFSLAWCRENVVIPIEVMDGTPFGKPGQQTLMIAVGNITFLGTIGGFIKQRVGRTGLECQFIEKPPEEIQALLDQAAAQRLISGDVLDPAEYDEEALAEALKEAGDGDPTGINFEFDDEDELSVSKEEILNISNELLGSALQRAAAQILVKAVKDDVSDIHIEPQENEYRVRLRQDGVLRPFIRIPSRSGIKLTAVLKTMAGMNVAERRASQDGRILRKLEGNKMEFRVSTLPSKYGEKTVLRVLKSDPGMLNLDTLVSNSEVLNRLRSLIHQSYGIIIVAGPTGSQPKIQSNTHCPASRRCKCYERRIRPLPQS
jgi:type IV pilus assembly protein PilB